MVVGGGGPQLFSVSPSPKPPGSFGILVCLGLAGGLGRDLDRGLELGLDNTRNEIKKMNRFLI